MNNEMISSSASEMMSINNIAVTLLESGNVYEARQVFYMAKEMMKRTLDQEMIRRKSSRGCHTDSTAAEQWSASCPLPSSLLPFIAPTSKRRDHASSSLDHLSFDPSLQSSSSLYSFLRPLYFSQDIINSSNPPMIKLSISLLFNLALSNHAIAMMQNNTSPPSCSSSTSFVEEAIFFYKLAYSLQVDDCTEVSWLHSMGMINNVGKLLAGVGVYEESQNCFRHLLIQLIMVQIDQQSRCNGGLLIETTTSKQIEGFLDNIWHMVLNSSNTSAAA
jgi:hypothetical protein